MIHHHGDIELGEWVTDDSGNMSCPVTLWYDMSRVTDEYARQYLIDWTDAMNPITRWKRQVARGGKETEA